LSFHSYGGNEVSSLAVVIRLNAFGFQSARDALFQILRSNAV